MKFSVIVPVYNVAEYLPVCMDSLLSQDLTDCEILLVDDGSTDGKSGELCDEYAAKYPGLVRVIHQENGGLGEARNTGIAHASGEYLLFLDSDDSLEKGTVQALREQTERTQADMYIYSFRYLFPDGERPAEPRPSGAAQGVLTLREKPALLLDPPMTWLRLCRRELFDGIRFPHRLWFEDLYTTPKLLYRAKSILQLDAPFYRYLVRPGSIMRSANLRRNLEILEVLENVRLWFENEGALETCRPWLCVLAVDSVLAAARRVLTADPKAEYLPQFVDYVKEHYPDYRAEPLLATLGKKKLILLRLLEKKRFRTAKTIFALTARLSK